MSTMTAFWGFEGSTSPVIVPWMSSYWPTEPKAVPPKVGDSTFVTMICVTRALDGLTNPRMAIPAVSNSIPGRDRTFDEVGSMGCTIRFFRVLISRILLSGPACTGIGLLGRCYTVFNIPARLWRMESSFAEQGSQTRDAGCLMAHFFIGLAYARLGRLSEAIEVF